jgi:hypothetical protein
MSALSLIPEHLHADTMSEEIEKKKKKSVETDHLLNECLTALNSAYKYEKKFPLEIHLTYETKDIYRNKISRRYGQKHIDAVVYELKNAGYEVTTTERDCRCNRYCDGCDDGQITIDLIKDEDEDEDDNEE